MNGSFQVWYDHRRRTLGALDDRCRSLAEEERLFEHLILAPEHQQVDVIRARDVEDRTAGITAREHAHLERESIRARERLEGLVNVGRDLVFQRATGRVCFTGL